MYHPSPPLTYFKIRCGGFILYSIRYHQFFYESHIYITELQIIGKQIDMKRIYDNPVSQTNLKMGSAVVSAQAGLGSYIRRQQLARQWLGSCIRNNETAKIPQLLISKKQPVESFFLHSRKQKSKSTSLEVFNPTLGDGGCLTPS